MATRPLAHSGTMTVIMTAEATCNDRCLKKRKKKKNLHGQSNDVCINVWTKKKKKKPDSLCDINGADRWAGTT